MDKSLKNYFKKQERKREIVSPHKPITHEQLFFNKDPGLMTTAPVPYRITQVISHYEITDSNGNKEAI